jgi:hypothetical protein
MVLAAPASAATINVMAGGACPNHTTVFGAACSQLITCGDAATPCCTWAAATAHANVLAGTDQILLHQFTEVVASPAGFPKYPGSTVGYPSYFVQSGRVSVSPAGADAYVLDLNNQLENGPVIRAASAGSVYSKGAGSFTITGKKDSADNLDYSGRNPTLYINADDVTIDGLTIVSPNFRDASISGQVGIRFANSGNGERAEGGIIRNCTIVGQMNTGIYISSTMVNCNDPGYAIYGNTINNTMVSTTNSSCTGMIVEATGCNSGGAPQSGKILWLNNYEEWTGTGCDSRGFYLRESTASIYIGNSRIRNVGSVRGFIYFQDNVPHGTFALEDVHIFNVTVTAAGPSGIVGDDGHTRWPECAGSQPGDPTTIEIVNGLFSGFSQVVSLGAGCSTEANTYHPRSTHDRMDHNLCYHASTPDCLRLNGGAPITETNSIETTISPGLTAALKIGAGSSATGACTNDPLGQGANVCSLTSAGETIDCSKDYEGDQRSGDAWDCGADQYNPDGGGPSCGAFGIEDGGACDDGDACTLNDACAGGACVGGSPLNCDDGNICTHDTCSPVMGCVQTPIVCNDRNPCTDDTCSPASGCVLTNNTGACSDGNACTTGDTCSGGACSNGAPRNCDDLSVCTIDSCSPATGCAHTLVACDDNDPCTNDTYNPAIGCVSIPVICTASDPCHLAGTCDPSTGSCSSPAGPDGVLCSDGNACTLGESCQAGVCTSSTGTTCPDDGIVCNGPESCNPSSGVCASGPPADEGTTCSDGNACTTGDRCQAGVCTSGTATACPDDGNACNGPESCDPSSGQCASGPLAPARTICSDGDACTQSDACDGSGLCVGSSPTVCLANGSCHDAGTCDPSTGSCSSPMSPDGTACDDGDPCTIDDACGGGVCSGGGTIGAPPETQDVTIGADKASVSWSATSSATRYGVVRGSIDALPVGPGNGDGDEICFEVLSGTTFTDAHEPDPGGGFWYLSRGENACGIGVLGAQGDGSPRITTTCP